MPDEVVSVPEQRAHEQRVLLEVDALDRWAGGEARALDQQELEALGERTLGRPRRRRPRDAPVDEHETFHHRDSMRVTNSSVFGSE